VGGGFLAPEWDETNSTYYVRLVDSTSDAATYNFTYLSRELRPYIAVGDVNIYAVNAESGRNLGWREEGDQKFLVESDDSSVALFSFAYDGSVALACPRIYGTRCAAYNLVSSSDFSLGVAPYEDDGAVYFQLSSSSDFAPFLLLRPPLASSGNIEHPIL
jgi:hypothetical protein